LYEVLTWRPPFQGSDSRDTLSRIIFQDPVPPARLNESIPRDLETIVLKCLRKDPADRYGTAEALAQDLRRFVRGDAIEARPQGRLERLVRRLARQKLRLLAAAGAAVLLIACAALAWRLAVETAKQRSREYERTVVAAAMKLLRGETVFSGHRGSAAEGGSFLPAEYREVLDERGRAAVGEALADLDRAAASLPERFEAHYHRARALLLLGRGAEAVRELEEALARRPGFAPALVLKAEALGGGDQQPALAGGARGEAWSRARHAMKRWRFEEAAAAYGELIALEEAEGELYPGSGIAHLLARGAARIHAGDHEGAISDFWQARALSRASWGELLEPHLLLGMAYFLRGSAGDLERAEERLREAASLCASGEEGDLWAAAVYSSLVGWCKHLGRLPDAVEAARKAVRLQPGDLRPRLALGWALLGALWVEQQGEGGARGSEGDEEAWSRELLEVAAGALELDHTSAAAHHLMGKALEARGEREKARSFFERAQERQESEVLQGRSDRNQGRSDMKNAKGRAAVVAASLVVALSGAGGAQEGTFEDVRLVESPVNSPFGDLLPCLSDDGLEMYFGSWRPGGKGRTDLYVAWRLARDEPWGAVRALEELNTPDSERGPSSADGLTLYFESNGLGGAGGRDIFVARRGARWDKEGNSVPFGPPENLVELNSSSIDGYPDISQDGLELFFTSDRPGGRGGWDLSVATWVPTEGRFGEPAALVNVNSGGLQLDPSISCDGLTLFFGRPSTTTSPGLGEVLVASRRSHDAEFGTPEPLGLPVNAGDLYWGGIPDISCDWPADGALLYFVRFVGIPQIYQATWRAWPAAFTASPETGEDPLHVSFDASRSRAAEGASIASYLWTFGDGESGAGVAVEHTYALPGKHSAVLVVTDDAGRSQRAERAIDVRFRPGSAEPWTSSDIGSPAASGAARMEDGCLTSFSGGIGFQGRSDEGHLAYQEVSGDVVLAANVRGLWSEGTGGQSGVILRASAEADSPFAAVLVEQAGTRRTFRLRYREAAGASARSVTGADVELPGAWVRISRRGGTVVGESSSDGTSWSELGRVALDLPPALVAGVATAARSSTGVRCAARVCGITLEAKPALAFRRGEANQDGKVDISDAVSILQWLFLGEAEPGCLSAADVDGDKAVNITDPIYLLTHLFLGGPSPPEPFATCGPDPSPDGLPCESLGPCP
ncbi:MAG: PKD domain-containing protein, partial [Planctomycetes bacterium]|nr:PKD domain-containing protein [Planctomycetota bacterium]